jgi:hypothetical protein
MGPARDKPRIECRSCVHHYVTWEPAFPHGCRALGFKSKVLPSLAVFQSSGLECQAFEPRPGRQNHTRD